MNVLFRLRKDMPISKAVPFKYLLYSALLSDVIPFMEDDVKSGIFSGDIKDLEDFYSDWCSMDTRQNELQKALKDLGEEGLVMFDEEGRIFLGEYRGSKFFPFEGESSLYESSLELLYESLNRYSKSKSAKDKSRSRYIKEQVEKLISKDVDNMTASDFTDLHSYMYEIYTGGELYIIRSKIEYYQTNNMLKAYDKHTVFALIVNGTLKYDFYRKKGIPTLTNVAVIKDDVFKSLTKPDEGSKEYMREMSSSISDDSGF